MIDDQEKLKACINVLCNRKKELNDSLKAVEKAIDSLQNVCTHQYAHIGNNHNDDIEECEVCKHIRYV